MEANELLEDREQGYMDYFVRKLTNAQILQYSRNARSQVKLDHFGFCTVLVGSCKVLEQNVLLLLLLRPRLKASYAYALLTIECIQVARLGSLIYQLESA